MSEPSVEDLLARVPRDEAELATFLRVVLGLSVPRRAMIEGHHAPMEYLAHAFFEEREPRDIVVWAARGGGKTFLGAVATLLDLVFKPEIEIRILGGSLEQSRRMHAHLRRLFSAERHPALAELVQGRITDKRLRLRNGSEVELLAQSHTSVRGTRVQKLRCDEVDLFHPDVWEAAQLTTRSVGIGGRLIRGSVECLSTMHLPHGVMHTLVEEGRTGARRLFRWGVVDVLERCGEEHACRQGEERLILPRGAKGARGEATREVAECDCPLWEDCRGEAKRRDGAGGHMLVADAVRMKARVSQATWNAEMLCRHPRRSDAVYPEFSRASHVRVYEGAGEGAVLVCGMDFGYRAPTVVLWAVVEAGGTLWVVDERAEEEVVLEDHVKAILDGRGRAGVSWPKPTWIGVDPAGQAVSDQTGKSPVQVLRASGLTVRAGRLPLRRGLELVRARLRPAGEGRSPRIFVDPRCRVLIESLERYHYPQGDLESMVPEKDGSDHAADALRYLVGNLDRRFGVKVRPV